ncbi:MAG: hypothetical protein MJD61_14535 [Proteobacteria bacterium]|nr:hypothetical protein [Pseudomonadota bacterium]
MIDFADGSVLVECFVHDVSASSSRTRFYSSDLMNAQTADCTVVWDIEAPASNGVWNFERNGTTYTATYDDPGATAHGEVVTFAPSDCDSFMH